MIRYDVTPARLRALVAAEMADWLTSADERTGAHQAAGHFTVKNPNWSDIKAVFMALQHNKCAYCERKLDSVDFGKVEHDVEHFRPKNAVRAWPTEAMATARQLRYDFALGEPFGDGYYLLAHVVDNYVTACKVCNTMFKGNYFPVEGARVSGSRAVRDYDAELALLPNPLGHRGIRPETVLGFDGIVAVPRYKSGRKHRIGRVTIDLFGLNERDTLEHDRAKALVDVWLAEAGLSAPDAATREIARTGLRYLLSPAAPHSSCTRSFHDLIRTNRPLAARHIVHAREVLARAA